MISNHSNPHSPPKKKNQKPNVIYSNGSRSPLSNKKNHHEVTSVTWKTWKTCLAQSTPGSHHTPAKCTRTSSTLLASLQWQVARRTVGFHDGKFMLFKTNEWMEVHRRFFVFKCMIYWKAHLWSPPPKKDGQNSHQHPACIVQILQWADVCWCLNQHQRSRFPIPPLRPFGNSKGWILPKSSRKKTNKPICQVIQFVTFCLLIPLKLEVTYNHPKKVTNSQSYQVSFVSFLVS